MSVIVWDGKTLAADKQLTVGAVRFAGTKIFEIRGSLVGFSGDFDFAQSMKHWFESGCEVEKYPASQNDNDRWVGMLVVTKDRKIYKYERSPYPMDMTENKVYAFGSGREFALGALSMGADAQKAVEIAMLHEINCGVGIDKLTLED